MSEVWKSCTCSSQMRLLRETPYMYIVTTCCRVCRPARASARPRSPRPRRTPWGRARGRQLPPAGTALCTATKPTLHYHNNDFANNPFNITISVTRCWSCSWKQHIAASNLGEDVEYVLCTVQYCMYCTVLKAAMFEPCAPLMVKCSRVATGPTVMIM